jgi:hypothetical protein
LVYNGDAGWYLSKTKQPVFNYGCNSLQAARKLLRKIFAVPTVAAAARTLQAVGAAAAQREMNQTFCIF